ncbi:efflux RND transporter periplasmic adaptor subunit [Halomonas llamarensis]|uniref:Efflux RND transporter periplasmic adaptor subunit n=1 Tax=Halomonas llamarensis TaxID=2945104 RepID=A0ABT0SKT3_9GAMM|nr:efflux RND transporter periplasmic adaptor subunit [Halomonas llamarensis]MCL7928412.1 efflux RND transporter periplasmic adaptor subunit [Halomonas llamarensis]
MLDSRFRFSRQTGRFHLGVLMALLVLVGGLAIASWLLNQPPRIEPRPPPEPTPPLVDVIHTQRVKQAPTLEAFGRVEPEQQANIASRVAGELTRFGQGVVPGGVVEQGATLATIDQADLRLALADADAELANAQAQLALEQGEQQRARSEYQSFGRELSPERRALVLREPQLRQAQAGVTQARVARDQAALNLERATLTAPWRAMVQERLVGAGSLLSQGTDVVRLVGVEQFWVRASLPGEWLTWLSVGDRATLTSRGWPAGEQRQGELISILPNLEENGLQTQVLIAVEDPLALENIAVENIALESSGPALRLGDIVRTTLHPKPREALIALPSSALKPGDGVWTVDDNDQLRQATVTLAYRGEDQALVRAGIDAEARVVVAGLAQPREGQRVRVREAAQ